MLMDLNYSTFSGLRRETFNLSLNRLVKLADAQAIVDFVVREAPSPVSVFVADTHGELVAAATMDGAAPDTRLNAQRKAYTAARSDARSTRELAEKVREDAVERQSFDPFFTFFLGGLAAFDGETRVGAVGVSGLPGEVDEALARQALETAGIGERRPPTDKPTAGA
jgi:glc operon protein GlcG